MSGSVSSDAAEPNLTPILDMVFQLITFFMLVTNFKAAEMDLSLHLPVVGSAKPVKSDTEEQLLVLNIDTKGGVRYCNSAKPDLKAFIKQTARGAIAQANLHGHDLKEKDDLPAIVVIRADRETPFKHLNNVIEICQDNGYRNFAFKAQNKEIKTDKPK